MTVTILCVEDEREIRRFIVEELEDAGFTVQEAADGAAALEHIRADPPDLVLCDISMPGMTGFQVLETVRSCPGAAGGVPFVLLTAYGDRSNQLNGRTLGADDYLVKPIDFDLLLATVRTRLANTRRAADDRVRALETQVERLMAKAADRAGASTDMRPLLNDLDAATRGPATVIIVALDCRHRIDPAVTDALPAAIAAAISEGTGLPPERVVVRPVGPDLVAAVLVGVEPDDRARRVAASLVDLSLGACGKLGGCPMTPTTVALVAFDGAAMAPQVEDRMHDAVLAIRFVQRAGGRTVVVIDDTAVDTVRTSLHVDRHLLDALGRGEFFLCFQPKIRLRDLRVVGAEALIRWNSPDLGAIPPALFIPIAERTGRIGPIGDWVLNEAVRSVGRLHDDGLALPVAINASVGDLQADFVAKVGACLERHGVAPRLLEVEITETSVIADLPLVRTVLQGLRDAGHHVAVDDFGTGYSSFSYLRDLPLDVVKIDQSFIRGVDAKAIDQRIVESVIGLSRAVGLATVAEGVETAGQLDWLSRAGCDAVQGYHLARPMPHAAFERFLRDWPGGVADGGGR